MSRSSEPYAPPAVKVEDDPDAVRVGVDQAAIDHLIEEVKGFFGDLPEGSVRVSAYRMKIDYVDRWRLFEKAVRGAPDRPALDRVQKAWTEEIQQWPEIWKRIAKQEIKDRRWELKYHGQEHPVSDDVLQGRHGQEELQDNPGNGED
jgi:hypothetical protein